MRLPVRRRDCGDIGKKEQEKAQKMIEISACLWYNKFKFVRTVSVNDSEEISMKHIQTLNGATLKHSAAKGGCGECQTSCQSACKTSCTVANQKCENQDK